MRVFVLTADLSNDTSIFKVSQLNVRRSPPISIRVVQVLDPGTKPFAQTFSIPVGFFSIPMGGISRGSILLSLLGVSFLDQGILAPAGPEFPRAVPSRPGKSRSAPEKCRSAPGKCRSAPGRCRSAPEGSGKVPKCSRILVKNSGSGFRRSGSGDRLSQIPEVPSLLRSAAEELRRPAGEPRPQPVNHSAASC